MSVNWVSIGSDNGLSPDRHQAIFWTNAGILFIRPLGTNISESWFKISNFSFMKMYSKTSSVKWRPFCPGGNWLRNGRFHKDSSILFDANTIWHNIVNNVVRPVHVVLLGYFSSRLITFLFRICMQQAVKGLMLIDRSFSWQICCICHVSSFDDDKHTIESVNGKEDCIPGYQFYGKIIKVID